MINNDAFSSTQDSAVPFISHQYTKNSIHKSNIKCQFLNNMVCLGSNILNINKLNINMFWSSIFDVEDDCQKGIGNHCKKNSNRQDPTFWERENKWDIIRFSFDHLCYRVSSIYNCQSPIKESEKIIHLLFWVFFAGFVSHISHDLQPSKSLPSPCQL